MGIVHVKWGCFDGSESLTMLGNVRQWQAMSGWEAITCREIRVLCHAFWRHELPRKKNPFSSEPHIQGILYSGQVWWTFTQLDSDIQRKEYRWVASTWFTAIFKLLFQSPVTTKDKEARVKNEVSRDPEALKLQVHAHGTKLSRNPYTIHPHLHTSIRDNIECLQLRQFNQREKTELLFCSLQTDRHWTKSYPWVTNSICSGIIVIQHQRDKRMTETDDNESATWL